MIDVQRGEQPLKRVAARRTNDPNLDPDDMDAADDDNAGTALYAPYQTILYTAPSVVEGQIPKNVYGNLDVYVSSMVPPGGVHVAHPETARAARTLGIDYADAVTGFSFKGRHGTAITNGAVVATEYQEAVEEVIKVFEDERAQAEEEKRSLAALRTWKRLLAGLRIRERIEGYDIEGERDTAVKHGMERAEDEDEDEDEGGGFLPDRHAEEIAQPTTKRMSMGNLAELVNDVEGGGFYISEDEQQGTPTLQVPDHSVNRAHDDDDGDGGGFQMDSDEEFPSGIVDEKDNQATSRKDSRSALQVPEETDSQEILDQGGGFLPGEGDNRGEVSLVDDLSMSSNPIDATLEDAGSVDPQGAPHKEERLMGALPDLTLGELEEARILQQLYESQHLPMSEENVIMLPSTQSPDSIPMQESTAEIEWETSIPRLESYPSNEPMAEENPEPDSSEEDKGSLLSHDPEDEDADPEWLA